MRQSRTRHGHWNPLSWMVFCHGRHMMGQDPLCIVSLCHRLQQHIHSQDPRECHGHRIRKRHPHHPAIRKTNQGGKSGRQQKEKGRLPIGSRDTGNIGPGVNGDGQEIKLVTGNDSLPERHAALLRYRPWRQRHCR